MRFPFLSRRDLSAPRSIGWRRLLEGGRGVPVFAVVAIGSLALGLGLAHFVQPASLATPTKATAGLITAAVERQVLRNEVVVRADAHYADAVQILTPTDFQGIPIVTGSLPAVGAHVKALSVVAEISGRPIILLPGAIPAYRTLSFGLQGADVLELKKALVSVHIDPGDAASDVYDAATAAAVAELYQRVGYAPAETPGQSGDGTSDTAIRDAKDAVTTAKQALRSARRVLVAAKHALTPQGRLELAANVRSARRTELSAQRTLDAAGVESTAADAGVGPATRALTAAQQAALTAQQQVTADPESATAVQHAADTSAAVDVAQIAVTQATTRQATASTASADAVDALATAHDATELAIAARQVALATPDTGDQEDAVTAAEQTLSSARESLTDVENAALPVLPVGEVAFLDQLPRRVDAVTAVLGAAASGPLLSLSGATVQLVASVAQADASLLTPGDAATFQPPDDGTAITARVLTIDDPPAPAASADSTATNAPASSDTATGRMQVTLEPEQLSDQQITALDGANVRVTIPVGATTGKVLTVPIAAVSMGPGGVARVEVALRNDSTSFVDVTVGLAAQGNVEVAPVSGQLEARDRVVVGR